MDKTSTPHGCASYSLPNCSYNADTSEKKSTNFSVDRSVCIKNQNTESTLLVAKQLEEALPTSDTYCTRIKDRVCCLNDEIVTNQCLKEIKKSVSHSESSDEEIFYDLPTYYSNSSSDKSFYSDVCMNKSDEVFVDAVESFKINSPKLADQSIASSVENIDDTPIDKFSDMKSESTTILGKTRLNFTELLEELMSTPLDCFYPVDKKYKAKLQQNYEYWVKEEYSDDKVDAVVKYKFLFNNILFDWLQGKVDSDKTSLRLASLEETMNSYDCTIVVFLEQIIFLKRYYLLLEGKPLLKEDKDELTEALYDVVIPTAIDKGKILDIFAFDLYSLQILLFFNCLPKFQNFCNYEKGVQLLINFPWLFYRGFFLFSPISFTPYDYLRINCLDKEYIRNCLTHVTKDIKFQSYTLLSVIHFLNNFINTSFDYMTSKSEQELEQILEQSLEQKNCIFQITAFVLREINLSVDIYELIYDIILGLLEDIHCITLLKDDDDDSATEKLLLKEKIINKCNNKIQQNHSRKKQQKNFGAYEAIPYFLKAFTIIELSKILNQKDYMEVAKLYAKAADYTPAYLFNAYHYYKKAGSWLAAADAADKYAHYCKKNGIGTVEYWLDEKEKLLELGGKKNDVQHLKKQPKIFDADLDEIVKEIEGNQTTVKGKHRSRRHLNYKKKKEQTKEQFQHQAHLNVKERDRKLNKKQENKNVNLANDLHVPNKEAVVAKPQPIKQKNLKSFQCLDTTPIPIIKTIDKNRKQLPNKNSFLTSDDVSIVGARGKTIQPYQRLLSRYWNPKIQQVLKEIRAARLEIDINKERAIYAKVMGDKRYKSLIGIERIWEECAWSELHQFDDFFRTGILKDEYKSEAKIWIAKARKTYLLPALAHYFGMDEIHEDIAPEELWKLASELVEIDTLTNNKQDNDTVRFRLRCLFSSLGHVYSLLAMVDSRLAKKHKATSYKYFGYKSIDTVYMQNLSKF